MRWTCVKLVKKPLPRWDLRRRIKDPRGTVGFWGVKFNRIMIVFVGGQIFLLVYGTKSTTRALLHSLSQLKLSILDTPSGQKNPQEPLLAAQSYKGSLLRQMTDILLFQRLGERLPHIIFLISSAHTVPNEPFSSLPIKRIYCSSWVEQ